MSKPMLNTLRCSILVVLLCATARGQDTSSFKSVDADHDLGPKVDMWFAADGERVVADFVRAKNNVITLRRPDGTHVAIEADMLSEESQQLAVNRAIDQSINLVTASEFQEYQERLTERRVYALNQRRLINESKPPARGWTAISVPYNPIGTSAIELGWVRQPPIPYGLRFGYRGGLVPVRGYYRGDGTYVRPYTRRRPRW